MDAGRQYATDATGDHDTTIVLGRWWVKARPASLEQTLASGPPVASVPGRARTRLPAGVTNVAVGAGRIEQMLHFVGEGEVVGGLAGWRARDQLAPRSRHF